MGPAHPPSAHDVGMPAHKDYVAYETRKPRRVRFLLPEDDELTIDAMLVVFDRVMHKEPATTHARPAFTSAWRRCRWRPPTR